MAGKSFALVYAPSVFPNSFLHLNREGDHWKLPWYHSPDSPAQEMAQSANGRTRQMRLRHIDDLGEVEFVHDIWYPHSSSPEGVPVTDSRDWFSEIAKANIGHELSVRSHSSGFDE